MPNGSRNKMSAEKNEDYTEICVDIAKDIELLKGQFPQLKEFESSKNLDKQGCKISYAYRCHWPTQRPGWAGGVPNPDPEGIWFYIGVWDENDPAESSAQINTQPVLPLWHIKNRRVTYLILEGEKTSSVGARIFEILKKWIKTNE